jgi:hypothetical protein
MVLTEKYELDTNDLSLVRFDMYVKTSEIVEIMLDKLTNEEITLVKFLTLNLPFRSSMEDDDTYWDIIFVDYNVRMFLEHMLTKYNVKFKSKDITDLYYEKSETLDNKFIEDIDSFLDNKLDIDVILDKINSLGIDRLKKYELDFLNRQSIK